MLKPERLVGGNRFGNHKIFQLKAIGDMVPSASITHFNVMLPAQNAQVVALLPHRFKGVLRRLVHEILLAVMGMRDHRSNAAHFELDGLKSHLVTPDAPMMYQLPVVEYQP